MKAKSKLDNTFQNVRRFSAPGAPAALRPSLPPPSPSPSFWPLPRPLLCLPLPSSNARPSSAMEAPEYLENKAERTIPRRWMQAPRVCRLTRLPMPGRAARSLQLGRPLAWAWPAHPRVEPPPRRGWRVGCAQDRARHDNIGRGTPGLRTLSGERRVLPNRKVWQALTGAPVLVDDPDLGPRTVGVLVPSAIGQSPVGLCPAGNSVELGTFATFVKWWL